MLGLFGVFAFGYGIYLFIHTKYSEKIPAKVLKQKDKYKKADESDEEYFARIRSNTLKLSLAMMVIGVTYMIFYWK